MDNTYISILGGSFLLNANKTKTGIYVGTGIRIERSLVKMKGQFVGLDNTAENMYDAAYGFFHVVNCFDVEIDGARTLPRVYDRDGTANDSPAGTYGIGGSFTLFLKLKNITADGAAHHWGVMGTNTMKNMYIDHCNLSRVDVHFSAWNLYIVDCNVGDLVIKNTTKEGNKFVNFRKDYGSRWDGDIKIKSPANFNNSDKQSTKSTFAIIISSFFIYILHFSSSIIKY
jgi:hypothetical protein